MVDIEQKAAFGAGYTNLPVVGSEQENSEEAESKAARFTVVRRDHS